MSPAIKSGRIALFLWMWSFDVGDIVLGTQQDREVIKRISKFKHDKVWIKGDNTLESTDSDELGPVRIKAVKAKLFLVI